MGAVFSTRMLDNQKLRTVSADNYSQKLSTFTELATALHTSLLSSSSDKGKTKNGRKLRFSKRAILIVSLLSSTVWYLLRLVIRDWLSNYRWFQALKRKGLFELYLLATINAAGTSLWSLWRILTQWDEPRGTILVLLTALGYYVYDLLALYKVWSWKQYLTYGFHHLCCIWSITTELHSGSLRRFVACILFPDISTTFLNMLWLLRELKIDKYHGTKLCETAFISSFFLIRIVLLPIIVWRIWGHPTLNAVGMNKYTVPLAVVLNFYWFKGIISRIRKK